MIKHITAEQLQTLITLAEEKDRMEAATDPRAQLRAADLLQEEPEVQAVITFIDSLPKLARREVAELYYFGSNAADSVDAESPNNSLSDSQIGYHIAHKARLAKILRSGIEKDTLARN